MQVALAPEMHYWRSVNWRKLHWLVYIEPCRGVNCSALRICLLISSESRLQSRVLHDNKNVKLYCYKWFRNTSLWFKIFNGVVCEIKYFKPNYSYTENTTVKFPKVCFRDKVSSSCCRLHGIKCFWMWADSLTSLVECKSFFPELAKFPKLYFGTTEWYTKQKIS